MLICLGDLHLGRHLKITAIKNNFSSKVILQVTFSTFTHSLVLHQKMHMRIAYYCLGKES